MRSHRCQEDDGAVRRRAAGNGHLTELDKEVKWGGASGGVLPLSPRRVRYVQYSPREPRLIVG